MCRNCDISSRISALAEDMACEDDREEDECEECSSWRSKESVLIRRVNLMRVTLDDLADELDDYHGGELAHTARVAVRAAANELCELDYSHMVQEL